MQCRAVEERMSAWLDGEVSNEEDEALAVHIATCTHCARIAGEYRQLSAQMTAEFQSVEAPIWFETRVFEQIQEGRLSTQRFRVTWAFVGSALFMTLLVSFLAVPLGRMAFALTRFAIRMAHGLAVFAVNIIAAQTWLMAGVFALAALVVAVSCWAIYKMESRGQHPRFT